MLTNRSENFNEFATALAKAQGQITCAIEDKINPHFKSSYASLNSIFNACRNQLSENGICIVQSLSTSNDMYVLTTLLAHSSGQWISSELPIANLKCTPQALGSALTYFKRYSLSAMTGVSSGDDDDANSADLDAKKLINEKPKVQPNVTVKMVTDKAEGYDDFCIENQILPGQPLMKYVDSIILGRPHFSKEFIINSAIRDPDKFFATYEDWKKENTNE